jgi:hypothetical protein
MNVGPYNFEPATYFPEIDHLRAGGGQIGDSTDAQHVFFYAPDGETPLGIELFGPRAQLETEGSITVGRPRTHPRRRAARARSAGRPRRLSGLSSQLYEVLPVYSPMSMARPCTMRISVPRQNGYGIPSGPPNQRHCLCPDDAGCPQLELAFSHRKTPRHRGDSQPRGSSCPDGGEGVESCGRAAPRDERVPCKDDEHDRVAGHREPGPRAGRERYFARGGPERWIRVVTELDGDADRVVTAFPQVNDPRDRGWRR